MICVLDSNVMIAYLRDEEGAEVVEGLLLDPSSSFFAHGINLCEVYYDASGPAEKRTPRRRYLLSPTCGSPFVRTWTQASGKMPAASRQFIGA